MVFLNTLLLHWKAQLVLHQEVELRYFGKVLGSGVGDFTTK